MRTSETHVRTENESLKRRFAEAGLDLAAVWLSTPDDLELENRQLRGLWDWVCAYRRHPDRAAMQNKGYDFPPVEPDCDPDTDWLRFELWMKNEPVDWSFVEEYGPPPDQETLTDAQLKAELARIEEVLNARGVCFSFVDNVPARAVYAYLRRELQNTRFDRLAEGARIHITGCTGWCEECFQRKWCETAGELWENTVAAGGAR
ncbi:MAG: hypothetical protein FJ225_11025 [Lentisphaerae bacterium]|nr:hypothetical protein [Lentisphaerota bacterium]